MKRNIEKKLTVWKKHQFRKPMIIRGARQTGKTYSVTKFGESQFEIFIKLDFERDRSLYKIFSQDMSVKKIIRELEVHTGRNIIIGKTLLFFDEIQECEKALLSLRYFYEEEPGLHIIAAGSMLEFTLSTISFPVGRVTFEKMMPMTFYEFLNGLDKKILAGKLPCISNFVSPSEMTHLKIMEQVRLYLLIGGMPEAVERYRITGSLTQSFEVHEDIYQSYLQSLVRYNKISDIDSLDNLMRSIPSHIGSQVKYTRLVPDQRIEKTKKSLKILERALILHIVKSASATGLPLNANASSKVIKAIFLDIGLMQYVCGINPSDILNEPDISNIYKGALSEQFVGQELIASGGSENFKMFYWSRAKKSSSAEIDYLYVRDGQILPIEVKSGPAGKLKSMHIFLNEHSDINRGYIMSPVSFQEQNVDKLTFIPFYTRFF